MVHPLCILNVYGWNTGTNSEYLILLRLGNSYTEVPLIMYVHCLSMNWIITEHWICL
jgi:hypothetical protein